jgi:hypothetical protein
MDAFDYFLLSSSSATSPRTSTRRRPVLVAVVALTALGSEDHSARFGGRDEDEREPFSTDRFRREGAPAPERLRT